MKRLITDDYPCRAVKYWILCNGGGHSMRVLFNNGNTVFVNAYGDTMNFNHSVDFNSAKVYEGRFYETNLEELCGEEER